MWRKKPSLAKAIFSIFTTTLMLVPGAWASGKGQVQESVEAGSPGKASITVLYDFGASQTAPQYPQGVIAQGRDGNLYSTTPYGGTSNDGTVFRITPAGKLTVIYELSSYGGSSGLALGTDGNFYGATVYGGNAPGYGTAFRITPHGQLTTLYDFSGQNFDAYPFAPPIQGRDGNFYGTTDGDFVGNGGTVYMMTPSGDEATLFQFDRADGAGPVDPLIQATDGNFYGTTNSGGASGRCGQYGCGTLFKLTPEGALTVLHSFNVMNFDGYYPVAPVVQGSDGNFYGTVPHGGKYGWGIVFKITPRGKYTILHSFNISDGRTPQAGLLLATDGNFYGSTEGSGKSDAGTVFKVTPSGQFSLLYSFDGTTSGFPIAGFVQHTNGKLYGDTLEAGKYNFGTFYSLDLGLSPFVSLISTSGKVGKSVGILGQGFTGTTSVSFNGTSAKFKVVSGTYLTAVVPSGATTGFVTVSTPGGKLKSNKKFQVMAS
jgi:uncharacterized repeat protein (TIGR03803 family)